jgi:transposase-like protein
MCETKLKVSCFLCHSAKVVKNGIKGTGQQKFKAQLVFSLYKMNKK